MPVPVPVMGWAQAPELAMGWGEAKGPVWVYWVNCRKKQKSHSHCLHHTLQIPPR